MGEGHKKRNRAEKEALRLLKKLRATAEKTESQQREPPPSHRRAVYGPPRPPSASIPSEPQRTVIGPEIPDFLKEQLQTEDTHLESEVEEDSIEGDVVGPSLPDDWSQQTSENDQGKRRNDDEVERILSLMKQDGAFLDPYSILGISMENANDAAVKKAYWKCSLLVHPDKNAHPQAQKAFQALNRAWKEVQSSDHRLVIEKKRDDATMRQQAELEAKKAQRQQEWMYVMHPESKPQSKGREAWMTELPALRSRPPVAKQINQTTFSRKSYADISEGASHWKQKPNGMETPAMSFEALPSKKRPMTELASKERGPSLMEQHQAGMKQKSKKTQSASSGKGASKPFEYRPFDREKDLELKKGNSDGLLKNIGSLASRFG